MLDQSPSFLCYKAANTVHGYWLPAEVANMLIPKTSKHYLQYFTELQRNYKNCKHKKEKEIRILSGISISSSHIMIDSYSEEFIHYENTGQDKYRGLESLNRIYNKIKHCKNNLSTILKDKLVKLLMSKISKRNRIKHDM